MRFSTPFLHCKNGGDADAKLSRCLNRKKLLQVDEFPIPWVRVRESEDERERESRETERERRRDRCVYVCMYVCMYVCYIYIYIDQSLNPYLKELFNSNRDGEDTGLPRLHVGLPVGLRIRLCVGCWHRAHRGHEGSRGGVETGGLKL